MQKKATRNPKSIYEIMPIAMSTALASMIGLWASNTANADGMVPEYDEYAPAPIQTDAVDVPIDNSIVVKLDKQASTVVIGNPSVAEATVQNGNMLFVLGRTFGATNIIALDADNEEIANIPVSVTTTAPQTMTLHKGSTKVSYSCAAFCETALVPGDGKEHYETLEKAVKTKLNISQRTSADTGQE